MTPISQIMENFTLLDDWEDRYRYIIELGGELEPLTEAEHAPQYKISGCASQVWLITRVEDGGEEGPVLHFRGDSDAHIVRGLIAILLAIYSGKSARAIETLDAKSMFAEMGLKDHLTQQRANGLASMIAKVVLQNASSSE
ncbi:MAG: SufE family protein [Alphaproteobacteria bacterium]